MEVTNSLIDKIIILHTEGDNYNQISNKLNVNYNCIRRVLNGEIQKDVTTNCDECSSVE